MPLLKISTPDRGKGFTLIEILIVIGILTAISGLAVFVSLNDFRSDLWRNERNTAVTLLQRARSQSLSNICLGSSCEGGKAHGVHFSAGQYVLYQTPASFNLPMDWDHRDSAVDENISPKTADQILSGDSDVVFSPLSATATPASITVTNGAGRSSTITVGSEGQISWTH